MRTANPALNANTFSGYGYLDSSQSMTIQGTVNKTAILLGLVFISSTWTWGMFFRSGDARAVIPWLMIGTIGGLITAIVTVFNKKAAPISSPIYAVLEGLALGGISAVFEKQYPGIVFQAVILTFGTLFCLLMAYKSGLIRATENFKLGIVSATGAIFLLYIIEFVMGFFGASVPYIHESGVIGIGFSLFVVVIAALNLVLDFDFIENGSSAGAPKFMEWYAAFGLLVTLVWLYLEILRLLAKLNSRD